MQLRRGEESSATLIHGESWRHLASSIANPLHDLAMAEVEWGWRWLWRTGEPTRREMAMAATNDCQDSLAGIDDRRWSWAQARLPWLLYHAHGGTHEGCKLNTVPVPRPGIIYGEAHIPLPEI